MATLDEIYDCVASDETQRAEFAKLTGDVQALGAFLRERGCDATPEQAVAFLDEKSSETGELSDAELSSVSGGCNYVEPPCPHCGSSNLTAKEGGDTYNWYHCNDCTWNFVRQTK